jgi:hypothetical protein
MTTDEIKKRLVLLQDEINVLATMLPDNTQIAFGTIYFTRPTDIAERKRLVVTVKEPPLQPAKGS